jgi:hypothetical protein
LLVLVGTAACGGVTAISPTSSLLAPSAALPSTRVITGIVPPLGESAPCFVERYSCEVFEFSLPQEGTIGVTLSWDGQPRAMLVQLYWGDGLLAHEDVAPKSGPSRIAFQRPLMEATSYRVRVVSLEPDHALPFTLTLTLTSP